MITVSASNVGDLEHELQQSQKKNDLNIDTLETPLPDAGLYGVSGRTGRPDVSILLNLYRI